MAGPGGTVTGTIYSVGETQQVTDRFRKRVFVLTFADNPKYPQHVEFQVTGDKCGLLDDFGEGEIVTVEYNLRGRLRTKGDGCFNALEAWRIGPAQAQARAGAQRHRDERPPSPRSDGPPPPTDDDLPW